MRTHTPALQRGFTLVEVMVAAFVLLVGLLGTLRMLDTANAHTADNKAREGANNLARAVIENARSVPYESLLEGTVADTLKARPELGDSTPGTPDWTIERRGNAYTVAVTACAYDDAKDNVNVAARAGLPYCATSPSTGAPDATRIDENPDDFRRVDVTIDWSSRSGAVRVSHSALIINPSGGFGPRLITLVADSTGTEQVLLNDPAETKIAFSATTRPAASLHWQANDGASSGLAAPTAGAYEWAFDWDLGEVADSDAVLDGAYQVAAQAFDGVGIPGDQRTVSVMVDRSPPFAPQQLAGGRYDRLADVVELEWLGLRERDIVGYTVSRAPADGGAETVVCSVPADVTHCFDPEPIDAAATYSVRGVDLDTAAANARREGAASAPITVAATASEPPAFADTTLALAPEGELTWSPAADPDGSVAFYRIYRDATGHTDRDGRTETGAPRYMTPAETGAPSYWVTAVDDSFNESEPIGPVTLAP